MENPDLLMELQERDSGNSKLYEAVLKPEMFQKSFSARMILDESQEVISTGFPILGRL